MALATVILEGNRRKFTETFTDADGDPADPTTVTFFRIRRGAKASTREEFVYGTDSEVTKEGTGVYSATLDFDANGTWIIGAQAAGAVKAYSETTIVIENADAKDDDAPQLSHRALCSLEALKEYIPSLRVGDTDNDRTLVRLINAASDEIHTWTGREFIGIEEVQPATRQFPLDAASVIEKEIVVGDLATMEDLELHVKAWDASYDSGAVDLTYVLADPLVRQPWQPIGYLRFLPGNATPPLLRPGYYVEITGSWGFPTVPYDVEQACIVTAAIWYARDVSKFSETFSIDEQRVERPRNLPKQVRDSLAKYRVPGF